MDKGALKKSGSGCQCDSEGGRLWIVDYGASCSSWCLRERESPTVENGQSELGSAKLCMEEFTGISANLSNSTTIEFDNISLQRAL